MPANSRDDFTAKTKSILAKRVGYNCSNPHCRKNTTGPHTSETKATTIGIAAHISGAASGGPRYDESSTSFQRKSISNAIWLCSNCANLIDTDESQFPPTLLFEWKENAEHIAWQELLNRNTSSESTNPRPMIELDIIWSGTGKYNRGISPETLKLKMPIEPSQTIWINELFWKFKLALYNNSSYPLYNINIETMDENVFFTTIDKLPRINNLAPLANIDLEAKYSKKFIGTGKDAMDIIENKFPEELEGQKFIIKYLDENRKEHSVQVTLSKEGIQNTYLTY